MEISAGNERIIRRIFMVFACLDILLVPSAPRKEAQTRLACHEQFEIVSEVK